VAQAQQYIVGGHDWVVDLDLEKFFDRVNHDKLMGRIAQRIEDKRLLKLIRAFLNAGVMENGLVSPSVEGTPQGGPLSPLLSNVVLDELDRELERRGHRFVRYADDSNIYVRSERAGHRVMERITRFITHTLKLKVNETKSAVARPQDRKFLGFSFTAGPEVKRVIAPKALGRFKARVRESARLRRRLSVGSKPGFERSRAGPKASVSRRRSPNWLRTCGAGAAISASAKRRKRWSISLAGSGCDYEPRCGGSGKHRAAAGRRWWHSGSVRNWPAIRPAAVAVLGTSPGPRPSQ
jgi:hypothetical protein